MSESSNSKNAVARDSISRRRFLGTSMGAVAAMSIAGLAAPLLLAEDAPPPGKPLGFAFVGLGGFALGELMPGIMRCKYCKPVALVSGHPEKAARVANQYGIDSKNIYNYDNYDSIRDNPEIDAVYVVLPNGMHAEYTIRAFNAGKHVLCEKPMANTADECRQMIEAGKKAGKRLQIGYRMHWDAATLACIDALRRGEIGPISLVVAETGFTIGNPAVWRLNRKLAGGGCLMDIGIYSLSAARYLTGEEPTEVVAQTYQDTNDPRFKEVEQMCSFQLKFPSGAQASCVGSYSTNLNRYAIHGAHRQMVLEPGQAYNGVRLFKGDVGNLEEVDVQPADQFAGEMDGFALAIAGAGPSKAPGEEGLQDMLIIEAIYKSAREGRSVKLS